MGLWQGRSKRKETGGRRRHTRKKRKYELGDDTLYTFVGERKTRMIRCRGGKEKVRLLRADMANVMDSKTNKCQRVKIISVLENPANVHYVRRNIVTKGAIIEIEDGGKAKVTSRPSQHGIVNAIKL